MSLSVRLHLSLQRLLDASRTIVDTVKQDGYDSIMLDRLKIHVSGDKAFIDLHSGELSGIELPTQLDKKFIDDITCHDLFYVGAYRPAGEYRYGKSSAVLDKTRVGKDSMYTLKISGMDLNEMHQLHREVRGGLIWPVINYDADMVPPPARHLRQLLREAWAIICRDVHARFRRA